MMNIKTFSMEVDTLVFDLASDEERICRIRQFCELHKPYLPLEQFLHRLEAEGIKIHVSAPKKNLFSIMRLIKFQLYFSGKKLLISNALYQIASFLSDMEEYCKVSNLAMEYVKNNIEVFEEAAELIKG